MKLSVLRVVVPAILSGGITAATIQACSVGDGNVLAQSAAIADPIQGVWASQVKITNCATGDVMRSFSALNLFAQGGTMLDTDSQPPTGHGPALGTWSHAGGQTYASDFSFFRFNPDGSLAGSQQISRTITLDGSGQSFSSTIHVSVLDANGNQLMTACGSETATKQVPPQS